MVRRSAYLRNSSAEIISEGLLHITPDLSLPLTGSGHIDAGGYRLGTTDAFLRVMTYLGSLSGEVYSFLQ